VARERELTKAFFDFVSQELKKRANNLRIHQLKPEKQVEAEQVELPTNTNTNETPIILEAVSNQPEFINVDPDKHKGGILVEDVTMYQQNYNGNSNNNAPANNSGQELPEKGAGSGPNPNEIERVRDILFGGQQRDSDRRFKVLERRADALANDIHELTSRQEHDRIELDNRLTSIEQSLHQELEALDAKMQRNRQEMIERFSLIERTYQERLAKLEREFTEQTDTLQDGKIDRHDLADLLGEVGLRLRRQSVGAVVGQG
jgi:hypothetical protein